MEPLFRKVGCVSVRVDNIDEALTFYSEKLGHSLKWRSKTAAGMAMPDSDAELVVHTEERPMETDLLVASVPDAVSLITQAGGSVVYGPFEIPIGLAAVVSDPWGNRLILLDISKGLLKVDENLNVIEDEP